MCSCSLNQLFQGSEVSLDRPRTCCNFITAYLIKANFSPRFAVPGDHHSNIWQLQSGKFLPKTQITHLSKEGEHSRLKAAPTATLTPRWQSAAHPIPSLGSLRQIFLGCISLHPATRMAILAENTGSHPRVPAQRSIPPAPPGPARGRRPGRPGPSRGPGPSPGPAPLPARGPSHQPFRWRRGAGKSRRRQGERKPLAGANPTRTHIPAPPPGSAVRTGGAARGGAARCPRPRGSGAALGSLCARAGLEAGRGCF